METIHDKSYKTLFSSPLFVQQLCEGFLPRAIHSSLDFSTLQKKPGNYITPALRDLYQDVVWAVDFNDGKRRVPLYLCLLLSKDKLPPVLPIVLYSGKPPWNVATRMQDIMAAVPKLLRAFQPQLSYFLIDEHRLTQEAFEQAPELLPDTLLLNHVDNTEEFSACGFYNG